VSGRRQAPNAIVYRDYKEAPDSCVYALVHDQETLWAMDRRTL